MESTNKGGSEIKDCSFEAFKKSVLDAVTLSPSPSFECSGKCNDNTECVTISSEGSTTRLDSSDGTTTRGDSGDENRVRFEHPTISLDESKNPDYGDPFEGVFYRTETTDHKTVFNFLSKVFYQRFRDKIMSDFSLIMEDDVLRCTTHFRGLKCDLKIDNSSSTVIVSGVGHNIWREDFFPVIARLLFAQFVEFADSHVCDSFVDECADGRSKAVDKCTIDPTKAERISEVVQQASSQGPFTASKLTYDPPVFTSTPIINRTEARPDISHMPSAYEIIKKIDHMESELSMVKQSVISNMENQIQDLKSSVLDMFAKMKPNLTYAAAVQNSGPSSEVEVTCRHNEENGSHRREKVDVGGRQPCNTDDSNSNQSADEGFFNNSNTVLGSSQTFVKTTFPVARNEKMTEAVGQPVPVIITNRISEPGNERQNSYMYRETPSQAQQQSASTSHPVTHKDPTTRGRILLIGDSILNSINTKGLMKGIQKHSKGGATVKEIIEDISVYDMSIFEACIIYVGGNDCAKGIEVGRFVDEYDQLVSLIKTNNPECKVYICEIAPRGDVDVSEYNKSMNKLLKNWGRQNVYLLSNTYGYFFDKNNIPASRYFNDDGIHLSRSGVKRLVDAMSTSVKIVVDYELCVFSNFRKPHQNMNMNNNAGYRRRNQGPQQKPFQSYRSGNGNGRAPRSRNFKKQCYGCNMVGHILAECWNVK